MFSRVTVAQSARDESDMVEGPLKLTDNSIERVVSATTEYSRSWKSKIALIRWQATLEMDCDVEARNVKSQTCCQCPLREGDFAS